MTSKSRDTRLEQKAELEAKLKKREALLAAKGADVKKIAADIQIRELKAKIKESNLRLRAIDATEKRTGELAAMKAEKLAQAEAAKAAPPVPKKKKAEEAPAPEAKAKKKKKKDEGAAQQ